MEGSKSAAKRAQSAAAQTQNAQTQSSETSVAAEYSGPQVVSIKSLIEAGAHFGHQTTKWNPRMLPYIYGQRNGIHVINLDLTLKAWQRARKYIYDTVASGGAVLFVGTKNQARATIKEQALRSNSFHVTNRWLGGTLSNFETLKRSIDRMRKLEDLLEKAEAPDTDMKLNKKERLMIRRELEKLSDNLGGIRNMRKVPDVLFIIDVAKEAIAVAEARRLHIPVVALVDTNCDPHVIDFPIPSNDDATRTIKLFAAAVADVVLEAQTAYNARLATIGNREGNKNREEPSDVPVTKLSNGKRERKEDEEEATEEGKVVQLSAEV